jgi:hypothetical protein
MDPLSSVKEFREQQGSRSRVVKIAPPPPPVLPPAIPEMNTGSLAEAVALDDTGELDLTQLNGAKAESDTSPSDEEAPNDARGFARGRKRVVQVYLPAPTRVLLDQARDVHGTLGKAAMAALRGSYQWLVDTYTPEPVEAVGPFPAPRPTRRRLAVEDPRMRQLLVDPAEATGIETLADQLEMSLSELVTLAIDKFYGDPSQGRATTASGKPKAKV